MSAKTEVGDGMWNEGHNNRLYHPTPQNPDEIPPMWYCPICLRYDTCRVSGYKKPCVGVDYEMKK